MVEIMNTLDAKKAAELLFCSQKQIENLARNGRIPALKVGKTWIFPADVLNEFINEQARNNLKPPATRVIRKNRYPVL